MSFEDAVAKHHPMMLSIANQYRIHSYTFQDVYQHCLIALWKALTSYPIGEQMPSNYAKQAMHNELKSAWRKQKRHQAWSLHQSKIKHAETEDEINRIQSIQQTECDFFASWFQTEALWEDSWLTEQEKRCVALMLHGFSQQEVSQMLGKSKGTISKTMQSAREKTKRYYLNENC